MNSGSNSAAPFRWSICYASPSGTEQFTPASSEEFWSTVASVHHRLFAAVSKLSQTAASTARYTLSVIDSSHSAADFSPRSSSAPGGRWVFRSTPSSDLPSSQLVWSQLLSHVTKRQFEFSSSIEGCVFTAKPSRLECQLWVNQSPFPLTASLSAQDRVSIVKSISSDIKSKLSLPNSTTIRMDFFLNSHSQLGIIQANHEAEREKSKENKGKDTEKDKEKKREKGRDKGVERGENVSSLSHSVLSPIRSSPDDAANLYNSESENSTSRHDSAAVPSSSDADSHTPNPIPDPEDDFSHLKLDANLSKLSPNSKRKWLKMADKQTKSATWNGTEMASNSNGNQAATTGESKENGNNGGSSDSDGSFSGSAAAVSPAPFSPPPNYPAHVPVYYGQSSPNDFAPKMPSSVPSNESPQASTAAPPAASSESVKSSGSKPHHQHNRSSQGSSSGGPPPSGGSPQFAPAPAAMGYYFDPATGLPIPIPLQNPQFPGGLPVGMPPMGAVPPVSTGNPQLDSQYLRVQKKMQQAMSWPHPYPGPGMPFSPDSPSPPYLNPQDYAHPHAPAPGMPFPIPGNLMTMIPGQMAPMPIPSISPLPQPLPPVVNPMTPANPRPINTVSVLTPVMPIEKVSKGANSSANRRNKGKSGSNSGVTVPNPSQSQSSGVKSDKSGASSSSSLPSSASSSTLSASAPEFLPIPQPIPAHERLPEGESLQNLQLTLEPAKSTDILAESIGTEQEILISEAICKQSSMSMSSSASLAVSQDSAADSRARSVSSFDSASAAQAAALLQVSKVNSKRLKTASWPRNPTAPGSALSSNASNEGSGNQTPNSGNVTLGIGLKSRLKANPSAPTQASGNSGRSSGSGAAARSARPLPSVVPPTAAAAAIPGTTSSPVNAATTAAATPIIVEKASSQLHPAVYLVAGFLLALGVMTFLKPGH